MLDGLDKPVAAHGSQIPLCEIRSDGRDNLITALLIAGEGIVRETCLYFGGKLLRGNPRDKILRRRTHRFRFAQLPEPCRGGHFHQI